jgi:hypothetical protein
MSGVELESAFGRGGIPGGPIDPGIGKHCGGGIEAAGA